VVCGLQPRSLASHLTSTTATTSKKQLQTSLTAPTAHCRYEMTAAGRWQREASGAGRGMLKLRLVWAHNNQVENFFNQRVQVRGPSANSREPLAS
jgi:hypothetical protein